MVNEFLKGGGKSGTDFAIKKKIPPTTFNSWVKLQSEGKLVVVTNGKAAETFRLSESEFPTIEKHLIEYIEMRKQLYYRDKLGLSWDLLKEKARQIAEKKASSGRVSKL